MHITITDDAIVITNLRPVEQTILAIDMVDEYSATLADERTAEVDR